MISQGNTLSKAERLSGKKSIEALLSDGRWGKCGCLKYCFLATSAEGQEPAAGRIMISVPKRLFKRAVKRNLLKRRIREAYRSSKICGFDILFQYNSAELCDYASIKEAVDSILERLSSQKEQAVSE